VIALLHYAWLKGMRDRSLPVFVAMAPVQIAGMLIAMNIFEKQFRYPLPAPRWDRGDMAVIWLLLPAFIATLSAFWTFRSEVATKAIGAFFMGSRPVTIVFALIVFAALTAIAGIVAMLGVVLVLTAGLPPGWESFVLTGIFFAVGGAALGALYVTISPQPAMLVWAFLAGIPFLPLIFDPNLRSQVLLFGPVLWILSIGVSTFLLRRRCAT
jgi:hypothetical protein